MKATSRLVMLSAISVFLLGASLLSPSAGASPRLGSSTTTTLAPGVTLTEITDPTGPYQIRILTIDPGSAPTLDVAPAGHAIGGYAGTSQIGASVGALAAINGDFSVSPGRPVHAIMHDGAFLQTGLSPGAAFTESYDKTQGFIGHPHLSVGGLGVGISGSGFTVTSWNSGPPGANTIVAFSRYGGSYERSPSNACAIKLIAPTKLNWTSTTRTKLTRSYRVRAARCSSKAMTFGRKGAVILAASAGGSGASTLKRFPVGTTIRLRWSDGWTGSMDEMGGQPLLLDNGVILAPATCGSYFCLRNPRTGVGLAADGRIFLVTVDGRCTCSVGMTLVQFAKEFQSLGAQWAINLDGGGGTTMWVHGQGVVNHPSDSTGERPVTTALVILPGADLKEPTPGFLGVATPAPFSPVLVDAAAARSAATLAAIDPGSTGGLLQAIVDGGLGGRPSRLSASERSTLQQFLHPHG